MRLSAALSYVHTLGITMWASAAAAILLCCFRFVDAAPLDYFPLNAQLPPVARISQPFSFVFSPLTFSSPLPMVYSLIDPPPWLSIDSGSRRLFGVPGDDNVPAGQIVGVPIQLKAEDDLGSIIANATLVVARSPPPTVRVEVVDQIRNFGPVSGSSSLHLRPSKPFRFSFDPNTFDSGDGSGLSYYAVTGDNAPLPSWLKFDASDISFSGTAPSVESLVQPPQFFDIQLVASDVLGFASVSVPLSIVVSTHELTTNSPVIILNATRGEPFEYASLTDAIRLDGSPLKTEDIISIATSGFPSWLRFDAVTWSLKGTPGPASKSANATLVIQDKFTDSLNMTLAINVTGPLFRNQFADLNLTGGDRIATDLKPYLWQPEDITAELEDNSRAPWLRLDTLDLSLSGTVPDDTSAFDASIALRATSKSTGRTEKQNMVLRIDPAPSPTSSSTVAPTNSSPAGPGEPSPSNKNKFLAILIPLLLLALGLLAVLLFFCLRRRKRESEREAGMLEVSAPIPGSFVRHDTGYDSAVTNAMFDIGPLPTNSPVPKPGQAISTSASVVSGASADRQQHPTTGPIQSESSGSGRSRDSMAQRAWNAWLAGRGASHSERHAEPDGRSLLSDTSLGEGDGHMNSSSPGLAVSGPQGETFKTTLGLNAPMIPEPFSIQNTPAIAYGPSDSHFSDDDTVKEHGDSPGLLRRPSARGMRAMSRRVSYAWKQGSASRLFDEYNRKSYQSSASGHTTRTSILTTGIVSEKPATASRISRPTVVHIPSRHYGGRAFSRRVGGSSPLFGGGSVVRSPRNLDVIAQSSPISSTGGPLPPPTAPRASTPASRDSDTSWDKLARDSLGIAFKDMGKVRRPSSKSGLVRGRHQIEFPSAEGGAIWHDRRSKNISPSEPEPTTPRDSRERNRHPIARTPSQESAWSSTYDSTPPGRKRLQRSPGSSQKIQISRARPYHHEARSGLPKAPSPHEWPRPAPAPPRPLPETPTRRPLRDRVNESSGGGQDRPKAAVLSRPGKTRLSDLPDVEDGWEDVRPDTSSGNLYDSPTGSYSVLI